MRSATVSQKASPRGRERPRARGLWVQHDGSGGAPPRREERGHKRDGHGSERTDTREACKRTVEPLSAREARPRMGEGRLRARGLQARRSRRRWRTSVARGAASQARTRQLEDAHEGRLRTGRASSGAAEQQESAEARAATSTRARGEKGRDGAPSLCAGESGCEVHGRESERARTREPRTRAQHATRGRRDRRPRRGSARTSGLLRSTSAVLTEIVERPRARPQQVFCGDGERPLLPKRSNPATAE